MSAEYQGVNTSYAASNAIDENDSTDPEQCDCCASTKVTAGNPWLQINLRDRYSLGRIEIFGRNNSKYYVRTKVQTQILMVFNRIHTFER